MVLIENPVLWCFLVVGVLSQAKTSLSKTLYTCAGTNHLTLVCSPGSVIQLVSTLYGAHYYLHDTRCQYIDGDCLHEDNVQGSTGSGQLVKDCNGKTSCTVTIKGAYLSCHFAHISSDYVGVHYNCVTAPTHFNSVSSSAAGMTNVQQTTQSQGPIHKPIKGGASDTTTNIEQARHGTNRPRHEPVKVLHTTVNSHHLLLIMCLVAGLVLVIMIYVLVCVVSKRCKRKKDEENIKLITSGTQTETLCPGESSPPLYRKPDIDDIYSDLDSLQTGPPPPKPPRSPRYGAVQSCDLDTAQTVGDTINETDDKDGDNEEIDDLYASVDTLQKTERSNDTMDNERATGDSQTTKDASVLPTEPCDTEESDIPHKEIDGDLYALPVKLKDSTK